MRVTAVSLGGSGASADQLLHHRGKQHRIGYFRRWEKETFEPESNRYRAMHLLYRAQSPHHSVCHTFI